MFALIVVLSSIKLFVSFSIFLSVFSAYKIHPLLCVILLCKVCYFIEKCLAQEHKTMSPARARIRSARSRVERTNHEATVPPQYIDLAKLKSGALGPGCSKPN